MTIAQLSLTDAAFLYNESGSTPMHIAAVQLFEVPPARRATFFAELREHYAKRLHLVPFFTRRAVFMPMGLDHPVWESCEVDLEHHIRQLRLAKPGSQEQLEALIAELHAQPLDRNRPLWRFYLIEGFEGDKVAFYTKMHHSAVDGMAGQALLELTYSDSPDTAPCSTECAPEVHSDANERMRHAVRELMLEPWRQAERLAEQFEALRRLGSYLARQRSTGRVNSAMSQPAPLTRLNVAVGRERSFAVGSIPMTDARALAKATGSKLNDVFMAICAGALRDHLLAQHELPPAPLLAGVPVSLRELGDKSMNNQVTMMLCSLATDVAEPIARLNAIRDSATAAKQLLAASKGLLEADMHVPGLPRMMASLAGASSLMPIGTPMPSFCNVVISNVPGPRGTKYLNGARMLTHYPVSIAAHGLAVNITVQSYTDRLDFAVTACRSALPDAALLRDRMLASWQALCAAAPARATRAASADVAGATAAGSVATAGRMAA